jgi:hypothetical protein
MGGFMRMISQNWDAQYLEIAAYSIVKAVMTYPKVAVF